MEDPEKIIEYYEAESVKEKKMFPFRKSRLEMLDDLGDFLPVVSTVKGLWESAVGTSITDRQLTYRERVDKAIVSGGCTLATALELSGYTGSMIYVGAGMSVGMQTSQFIEAMLKQGPVSLKEAAERAKEKHPQAAAILGKISDYCMKRSDVFKNRLTELSNGLKDSGNLNGPVKGTL